MPNNWTIARYLHRQAFSSKILSSIEIYNPYLCVQVLSTADLTVETKLGRIAESSYSSPSGYGLVDKYFLVVYLTY